MSAAETSIDIIGAIAPERAIASAQIAQALAMAPEQLTHGGRFTGRPGTRVLCTDRFVVKLHDELRFSARDARRWIEGTLAKERALGAHHPAKTWFLRHAGAEVEIANVTPLLRPLHQFAAAETAALLPLLEGVIDRYVASAARHDLRLDEGLSNFAADGAGAVYYLDDDTYPWDRFTSLAEMLAVWLRQREAIDADGSARLGRRLRSSILREFKDAHACIVLAENLRGTLAVTERQRIVRDACIAALMPPNKPRMRVPGGRRFAVLADVHANLPALRATLAAVKALGIDECLVLGDIVGYGPHPAECIEELRSAGLAVLKGNHDHAASTGIVQNGFSTHGRWVIDWTRSVVGDEHLRWLESLPPYFQTEDWLAVHGAPCDRTFFNAYVYSRTYEDNLDNLAERGIRTCFHGHSHLRGVYFDSRRERGFSGAATTVDLAPLRRALICPGSVGQPRGGCGGIAEFAVFDTDRQQVAFLHAPYDVETTIADMRGFGFPDTLQQRLRLGQ